MRVRGPVPRALSMEMIRTAVAAVGLAVCAGGPAAASDPVEPVQVLLDMAVYNAGVEPGAKAVYDDYFSAGMLLTYFSEGFVEAYTQALMARRKERDTMLLDHDPVLGGQDGCAPKDVTYGAPETKAGVTLLKVQFKTNWCYDGAYEGKDALTEVTYRLVQEDDEVGEARYVVDDIAFVGREPLRTLLETLAR